MAKRSLDDSVIRKLLYQFFGDDHNILSFRDRTIRRDFNLQVCVPIISYFLDLLSKEEVYREISFEEIFVENTPSTTVLEKFRNHFGFSLKDIKWIYDSKVLAQNIEHTMSDLLENVATIILKHSNSPISLTKIR